MIIGLSGKIGAGKDTVAEIIQYLIALDGAMGDKIKEAIRKQGPSGDFNYTDFSGWVHFKIASLASWSWTPISGVQYVKLDRKEKEIYREQFRDYCNLIRRHSGEDVWIDATFRHMKGIDANWVISDVRFKNEADRIKNSGGLIFRIDDANAPTGSYTVGELRKEITEHYSETQLDDYKDFDAIIENKDDLDALLEEVRKVLVSKKLISDDLVIS